MTGTRRVLIAVGVLALWLAVTLLGDWRPHRPHAVEESLHTGFAWWICLAALLAYGTVRLAGWRDVSFHAPDPSSTLRVLALPSVYLVVFLVAAIATGLPPPATVARLACNMLLVGFSEEVMFRGILFQAFRASLSPWRAVLATSVLFGGAHLLNSVITGDLEVAAVQAVAASLSGVFFLALAVRTKSLWPAILFHAAWDFTLTLSTPNVADPIADDGGPIGGLTLLLSGTLLVLPLALYGAFILHRCFRDRPRDASVSVS
ncbi:CPBP family intramembrane glutamic endopeptidase [Aureimonas jatrophae]|uniref:CAAX prenyl protease 2/Lysostaphin resistance protein A-like domain-containing protein n=1 Tax=Aureimonas jatrophae TaxID=1166073 RepID=A0A1H0MYI6_9HYPH|nr:CPBP family intramembrane glutamic endopeptidase [Aureimonas jatrophae]MBB3953009.1 hypothetical protein [Aureimonas jatrophae]SDO85528.1 hypothetical protein SAMN05192530_11614 [Aureimonas jatrophae]